LAPGPHPATGKGACGAVGGNRVAAAAKSALATIPSKPNLLVTMCDDLGYADIRLNVQENVKPWIPRSNIDKIATFVGSGITKQANEKG
jgi:hypothetical protein